MNKYFIYTIILIASFFYQAKAQLAPNVYWIQFTDKTDNPYSLAAPEAYLSARAIERRERYSIDIETNDIPINQWYLDSLVKKGANILNKSKWLNGAAVSVANQSILTEIYNLEFVSEEGSLSPRFAMNFSPVNSNNNLAELNPNYYSYGNAFNQIDLHKGQVLHNNSYRGEGIQIAIIDAGFKIADQVPALDSIFINNQIIGTWDFVTNDTNVFEDHSHGKSVLSTIAANLPGEFIGTAPKAKFLLLRSENAISEYKIEEISWLQAAEYADSTGVDIITTSLGYNTYSLPSTSYVWEDLDGQTAPITQGTNIAAEKGIFMVTSAGNEGSSSWKKIAPPADAQNALTVGACYSDGSYVSFSSRGNTADGRIKPDIVAKGQSATLVTNLEPTTGNGTSFSTPIIAGLVACLWQVDRSVSNFELKDLIIEHSSQYQNPDSLLGYGIPNFATAYNEIRNNSAAKELGETQLVNVYPTVFDNLINVRFFAVKQKRISVQLISISGNLLLEESFFVDSNKVSNLQINNLNYLNSGVYLLRVIQEDKVFVKRIIKRDL